MGNPSNPDDDPYRPDDCQPFVEVQCWQKGMSEADCEAWCNSLPCGSAAYLDRGEGVNPRFCRYSPNACSYGWNPFEGYCLCYCQYVFDGTSAGYG